MTSVFISSTHAGYYLFSKPFRAHGTLSYDSRPQNRIPLHSNCFDDFNDYGNKEDQEITIGSIRKEGRKKERKKENKNKKTVSIQCSMAKGTWWWVLEEYLPTKSPALQVP